MQEKDYTHRVWIAALALLGVLAAVSFIPPQSVGEVKLRRANILSDIMRFDDAPVEEEESVPYDEEEFHVDLEQVAERIEADTTPKRVQTHFEWQIAPDSVLYTTRTPDTLHLQTTVIPIQEPDSAQGNSFRNFCDTLLHARRPVRIAVLGDSFIEGDILTADLREKLQTVYGGGGTGFAPMASPLTAFRRSVKTQSKGWNSYNIMQRKAAPAALRDNFYISGWVCQPQAGASTRWESTDFRKGLNDVTTARIFFISPNTSHVEVILNDSLTHAFTIEGDAAVRQLSVTAPQIRSLTFRVVSGTEGFIGYGTVFEGDGVVVDNYSVRSNNGQAMFWTNPSVNAQINAMLGYDLVILQYGLNIMQSGIKNYTRYAEQIEKMVAYVRQCFPTAAVLVLGVSDRSTKGEAGFEPMDALPHMLRYQQQAAHHAGASFWNTCEAMRTQGGMERFVANGWAGKDYTHINYAGGRQVAGALFEAINEHARAIVTEELRRKAASEIVDTTKLTEINRSLIPEIAPLPLNHSLQ